MNKLILNFKSNDTKKIKNPKNFLGGNWKQTSYNGNIRKNFAGIGFTYDATKDAFIPPQPFPSWTLDESTCLWKPPVDYPSDGKTYGWFENSTSWKEISWDETDKTWKEV